MLASKDSNKIFIASGFKSVSRQIFIFGGTKCLILFKSTTCAFISKSLMLLLSSKGKTYKGISNSIIFLKTFSM